LTSCNKEVIVSCRDVTKTYDLYTGESDRIKAIVWEGDGYLLCYKRLETGRFQWPGNGDEVREITDQQLRWLMEGLSPEPKKRIPKVYPGQPDGI